MSRCTWFAAIDVADGDIDEFYCGFVERSTGKRVGSQSDRHSVEDFCPAQIAKLEQGIVHRIRCRHGFGIGEFIALDAVSIGE